MRLLVLAGGFGTRLREAVGDQPKALAPIGGVPFLRLQLEHWISQEVREFTFLLYHQADQIISFLQGQQSELLKDCHVDWLVEAVPMDTGGALANAVRELGLNGDFLVTNADTWLGRGMIELMRSMSPAMAVVRLDDVGRYGQVRFNPDFHVTRFEEKSSTSAPGWINAGIFRLEAALFQDWDGQPYSLERSLFVELVRAAD
ncbi:MAG: NTP transferase domain-containing protein [Betaproteobacteria bacterium]|nr:NTP transferase domain-containing protein [Betaproteobacteria bacterium]